MSMADNSRKRPEFLTDSFTPKAKDPASDPLAELARLIGQSDPFAEQPRKPLDTLRAGERPAAPEWLARPAAAPDHDEQDYEPRPAPRGDYAPSDAYAAHHDDPAGHGAEAYEPAPSPEPTQAYRPLANLFAPEGRPEGRPDGQAERYQVAAPEPQDEYEGQYEGQPYQGQSHQGDDRYRVSPPPAGDYEADSYYAEDGHMPPQGEDGAAHRGGGSRRGLITVAAVVGLAIIGTAGAFGYRAFTTGSTGPTNPPVIKADTTPAKIVATPVAANVDAAGKPFQDRVTVPGGERLQSREEQPIPLQTAPARAVAPPPQQAAPAQAAPPPASFNEPKRVKTIPIPRPDAETTAAFPAAPQPAPTAPPARSAGSKQQNSQSSSGPIQITPDPPKTKTASRTPAPAATSGAYAVQVSAQKTEAEAQSSYRALQSKYPSVLSGREANIKRVELSGGTWYRAQVGGFNSSTQANEFCDNLKAAGGQCIVQKN
jgi:cell division protein FtsN